VTRPAGGFTEQWRQLHFSPPVPDGNGEVLLDFNRTLNIWFAFTDYATCPAPIDGNVITVPVLAGEQRVSTASRHGVTWHELLGFGIAW
jgi:uncharacterized protein (DUF1684 family)